MIILMVPGTEQQQVSRLMDQLYGTTRYSANNHGDGILHGNGTMAYQPFADEDALMMVDGPNGPSPGTQIQSHEYSEARKRLQ